METHQKVKLTSRYVQYRIRKATITDSSAIWQIRNHPRLRLYFRNQHPINFKQHELWLEEFLSNKKNCFFVLEKIDTVPLHLIGYCRYKAVKTSAEVSIALIPEFQNLGLGSWLLKESLKNAANMYRFVTATVKRKNRASLQLFYRLGFSLVKQDQTYCYVRFSQT